MTTAPSGHVKNQHAHSAHYHKTNDVNALQSPNRAQMDHLDLLQLIPRPLFSHFQCEAIKQPPPIEPFTLPQRILQQLTSSSAPSPPLLRAGTLPWSTASWWLSMHSVRVASHFQRGLQTACGVLLSCCWDGTLTWSSLCQQSAVVKDTKGSKRATKKSTGLVQINK